jgi:hypothetical protein
MGSRKAKKNKMPGGIAPLKEMPELGPVGVYVVLGMLPILALLIAVCVIFNTI